MGLFSFLKTPAYIKPIEDTTIVKQQYDYWRLRIFYSMYLGYIFFYFTRKSLVSATPALIQELGLEISHIGLLSSILAISYGASKFLSGILADRCNPRYFMSIGLILTGICNIFFGMSSSLFVFAIIWGLNGWFQGWGWPPCARLLTHWYSQKERGRWWGVWNSSHSIGGAIIPIIVAFCITAWGWRYAMYVPGMMCIGMGLFVMNRMRDTPQSLGLPTIEAYKNDYPTAKHESEKELTVKEILFKYVLNNKYIWILAISYFFIYIIRQAVNDWAALYLIKTKGYSLLAANVGVSWFEIGGALGGFAAGWASDRIFQARRGPINVICSCLVVLAIFGLYFSPPNSIILDHFLIFSIGFLIFGPQMLIGMAAAELSHKKAAGTATGFTGWFAYLGASVAGYPITKVIAKWGWEGFFVCLGFCGLVAALLLVPLWRVKTRPLAPDQAAGPVGDPNAKGTAEPAAKDDP